MDTLEGICKAYIDGGPGDGLSEQEKSVLLKFAIWVDRKTLSFPDDPNRVRGCACGNTPCTCPF
jgi:hypothetical protein